MNVTVELGCRSNLITGSPPCQPLRKNLSSYDAANVALGEALSGTFVTLDGRIKRTPGLTCAVDTPRSA
jgi:hypothetical protein